MSGARLRQLLPELRANARGYDELVELAYGEDGEREPSIAEHEGIDDAGRNVAQYVSEVLDLLIDEGMVPDALVEAEQ